MGSNRAGGVSSSSTPQSHNSIARERERERKERKHKRASSGMCKATAAAATAAAYGGELSEFENETRVESSFKPADNYAIFVFENVKL